MTSLIETVEEINEEFDLDNVLPCDDCDNEAEWLILSKCRMHGILKNHACTPCKEKLQEELRWTPLVTHTQCRKPHLKWLINIRYIRI